MRIEVRKSGSRECLLEYLPDWTGAAPVLAVQSHCGKPEIVAHGDLGGREQRIVKPPELFRPQVGHPIGHNRSDVIAYREEGQASYLQSDLRSLSHCVVKMGLHRKG